MTISVVMSCLFCIGCTEKFCSWYSNGPIQVIGGNDQLWLFIEIDRMVGRSYKTYDAPSVYPVGHIQDILVISKSGEISRKIRVNTVDNRDGATFHPNNSHVFIGGNQEIYLYEFASSDNQGSLFLWKESIKRFVLSTNEDGQKYLKGIHAEFFNLNAWDQTRQLDLVSKKNGWGPVYADTSIRDDKFTWNGIAFKISCVGEKDKDYFEIKIESDKPMKDFPIVLRYDRDKKFFDYNGYKNLSDEEYGHPR